MFKQRKPPNAAALSITACAVASSLFAPAWGQDIPPITPTESAKPTPPTLDAQETKVAPGMAQIDVLTAKDAIRDQWANYTLLIDGDGTSLRQEYWTDLTFTKDCKWTWYEANGKTTGTFPCDVPRSPVPGVKHRPWKHLPIATKFDEITPTTAKTRTVVVMFMVPKAKVPGRADGVEGLSTPAVPQAGQAIYHDSWRKENGHWLRSSTIVYSANCGWYPNTDFTKNPTASCVDDTVLFTPPPRSRKQ